MPKGKKHTPEQIVRHLRDAEAGLAAGRTRRPDLPGDRHLRADLLPLEEPLRGHEDRELRRLKELEAENLRLKKLVADLSLDNAMLKELAEGNF